MDYSKSKPIISDYQRLLRYRDLLINGIQLNQDLIRINQSKINRIIEKINTNEQMKESNENRLNQLLIQEKQLLSMKNRPLGTISTLNHQIQNCSSLIHEQDEYIKELLQELEQYQHDIDAYKQENASSLEYIQKINEEIENINNKPQMEFKYQVLK